MCCNVLSRYRDLSFAKSDDGHLGLQGPARREKLYDLPRISLGWPSLPSPHFLSQFVNIISGFEVSAPLNAPPRHRIGEGKAAKRGLEAGFKLELCEPPEGALLQIILTKNY
jgi:hypothetical protein